ncbi:MAG: hypothetical protein H0V91_13655 [Flavisolibacter sp.]|nr:hypothetical protein [Flavisolibacter sp.]
MNYSFTNSTLLLLAFPSEVVFLSTGSDSPLPSVSRLSSLIPNSFTKTDFTAAPHFLIRKTAASAAV